MKTSAKVQTRSKRRRSPATTTSVARQIDADHTVILTSDLPDTIPLVAEELDLMHRYFEDLITVALTVNA